MSKKKKISKEKLLLLVVNSMLAAIIVLMAFTPIGYIQIGAVKMTLIMIPVAVGAITMGPTTGAFLGLVFGITSFSQCFGLDPFGTTLMTLNPIYTFIMCIIPRVLMGLLCGLSFKLIKKHKKKLSYFVASLSAPILNTAFFMGALILLFGNSDFIMEMRGSLDLFPFLIAFVGVNGLVEIIVTAIVAPPIASGLHSAVSKLK